MAKIPAGEPFPLEEFVADSGPEAQAVFFEQSAALEAGSLIREMRDRAELTQRELARRVGTSQSHLSDIERGIGLQGPTYSMLKNVARACNARLRIEIAPD
jgi:DNA-binding transcriptional regulator YiaG